MGLLIEMFNLLNIFNMATKKKDSTKDTVKKVKTPILSGSSFAESEASETASTETKKDKVVALATVKTANGHENQHFIESEDGDYPNGFQRDRFGLLAGKKYKIVTDSELNQLNNN